MDFLREIDEAADVIKSGGLCAFPTETVYGLGADAFNPSAVKRIYEAKGRPSDNPCIVHISDISQLDDLASEVPKQARLLADAFWPGPLTIILPKSEKIPRETSGGLPTVAIRFPSHPVARLLIERCKTPVAAPSANASGKPSTTKASHVAYDMDGKIEVILDAGPSEYGLESTIITFYGETRILRPGSVTKSAIEAVIGPVAEGKPDGHNPPEAPGMKYTHYSPLADVIIIGGSMEAAAAEIVTRVKASGGKTGVFCSDQTLPYYSELKDSAVLSAGDRDKPETIAASLFSLLRRFDFLGTETVYAETFYGTEIGESVMNRLLKAAGNNIIYRNKN